MYGSGLTSHEAERAEALGIDSKRAGGARRRAVRLNELCLQERRTLTIPGVLR